MRDTVQNILTPDNAVCGIKQVKKMLKTKSAFKLYVASDAQKQLVMPLCELAESGEIPVVWVTTKHMLGEMCGIDVGCAAAVVRNR